MENVQILLVTCCLEESRQSLLEQVVDSLKQYQSHLNDNFTVFDNASTISNTIQTIKTLTNNIYVADKNVGYWSAVYWWLKRLPEDTKYTYIIESDMVHYALDKLHESIAFLDNNDDIGSVRQHNYSVANRHLYNKDKPRADSKRSFWQSHTNAVTKQKVEFQHIDGNLWKSTFLTHLPALNRYEQMIIAFDKLAAMNKFSEFDFQKFYAEYFAYTGVYDGGIFHCDLNPRGTNFITGSWTEQKSLDKIGYKQTRYDKIIQNFNVTKL
jgi:hypothetical protein